MDFPFKTMLPKNLRQPDYNLMTPLKGTYPASKPEMVNFKGKS